ncbi:MAG: alanine racemase [Cellvibrionaceae bacterium]|nr:alanine racemase [Cellvibrionaceae bacterium]
MPTTGTLSIDLGAIANNWRTLKAGLAAAVECAAVVKADAYGLGAVQVVRALYAAGCRCFFVATVEEAVVLREAVAGDYHLVVLGGMAYDRFAECRHYKLIPVLTDFSHIERWSGDSRKAGEPLPSIIKVDTGMHRLGLTEEAWTRLLNQPALLKASSPMMLMSHLACADTPDAELNRRQLLSFAAIRQQMVVELPGLRASLANSSGIFLGSDYHFDCVRPGVAIYGANPTPYLHNSMQGVVTLRLPLTQIKTIVAGETVGYGAEFTADKSSRIGVVFGGYADGLLRALANVGKGYYHGHPVPLIGRVSMDALAFDLSAVPENAFQDELGEVELLGGRQSLDDLAVQAGTIAYEILTNLGRRYQRVYSLHAAQ